MRFKACPRYGFKDTSRKRAFLRRKQQNERDALPLFAAQIAAEQPSEDEVMEARAVAWTAQEVRNRDLRASKWLEARRRLASMTANEQAILRHAWNCAPYPADPVYLLDFLHSYSVGRFTLDCLPFDLVARNAHGHRIAEPFTRHPTPQEAP